MLEWSSSGQGRCPITLHDAQQLALEAGFTFKGSHAAMPLARRADLQGMFDHFDVNSLSAFRQLFWTHTLRADGTISPAGSGADADGLAGGWQVQRRGEEVYIGGMVGDKRHGCGILLSKGERSWLLYIGQFTQGLRDGLGVVSSSRGEGLEGSFRDDLPWGPAVYTHPPPAVPDQGGSGSGAARLRLRYRGMVNGRPQGRGCITWSDGSQEMGLFDGNSCCQALDEAGLGGVLDMADRNANEARKLADAVLAEARLQHADVVLAAEQALEQVAARHAGSGEATENQYLP